MIDTDTFVTILYVIVDDVAIALGPEPSRPGPKRSLSRSELVTLAIFSQWHVFSSQRAFYRWASRHLRQAFPGLPDRAHFNTWLREEHELITRVALFVVEALEARWCAYEAVDLTAAPVRDLKRRGRGWLGQYTALGFSRKLGYFEGFTVLVASTPSGVITGYGFAPANTNERPMADTLLSARADADPRLVSAGRPALGPYLMDKGFEGRERHALWREVFGVKTICVPKRPPRIGSPHPWPKWVRRLVASSRQIVETVNDKLHNCFRLGADRPHTLSGFAVALSAKVALHNVCIWINTMLGRQKLAFADLIDW